MLGNSSRHAAQLWRAAPWPAVPDTLATARLLVPALHARWLSSGSGGKEGAKGVPYEQLSIGAQCSSAVCRRRAAVCFDDVSQRA